MVALSTTSLGLLALAAAAAPPPSWRERWKLPELLEDDVELGDDNITLIDYANWTELFDAIWSSRAANHTTDDDETDGGEGANEGEAEDEDEDEDDLVIDFDAFAEYVEQYYQDSIKERTLLLEAFKATASTPGTSSPRPAATSRDLLTFLPTSEVGLLMSNFGALAPSTNITLRTGSHLDPLATRGRLSTAMENAIGAIVLVAIGFFVLVVFSWPQRCQIRGKRLMLDKSRAVTPPAVP